MNYYIIVEIQKMTDGSYAYLIETADNLAQAESIFYNKMSYAAISTLPMHAVTLLNSTGAEIRNGVYQREE